MTDSSAARVPGKAFCEGGTETCEVCVGSCGIEEYIEEQEARSAAQGHEFTSPPYPHELGEWHRWHIPPVAPWRLRDRLARLLGFHCWCCMVTK